LEEAERKRIAEIRKPKINQKSVKLARHRQYMYIMNVLEQYCDSIKVTPDTAIPYRVLIDIFINIGFYRKTIVQGEVLMFSDSEVTLHDEILKHLDAENIGFVKLESIIELINDLFESNNKVHDQFRTLLDCQLHAPPQYSSKIYDQVETKKHLSPTKKISLKQALETVERLYDRKEYNEHRQKVMREKLIEEELEPCTFKPKVSAKTRKMEFDSPVVKRLLDDAEERRNKDNEKEKICLSSKELGLSPLGSTTKRPLGYFKKEIFSPTTMPIGFGEAVQRLQYKRVQAMQEKHKQQRKRALFDERYKNRLGSDTEGKEPLMQLEIVLGANRVKRLLFHEDDNPRDVAQAFCRNNGIGLEVVERLTTMIDQNLCRLLED